MANVETEQSQVIDEPLQFEEGLVGDIAKSIMTPGYTANGVIQLMYYTFYALFATLFFMLFMTGGNPHVIALTLIAICLFVTIKWYCYFILFLFTFLIIFFSYNRFIAELEYSKRQDKKE